MVPEDLFSLALGLVPPWLVEHVTFTVKEKRLDLHINFPKGSRFACPVCGDECPVHDTRNHTWRHMDFFQHEAYLHARVPRVKCPEHGGHQIPVPWAREGSHFTLRFEALIMTLVREMPVLTAARMIGESDTLLWRIMCPKPVPGWIWPMSMPWASMKPAVGAVMTTSRSSWIWRPGDCCLPPPARMPPRLSDSPRTSKPTLAAHKPSRTSAWTCLPSSRKGPKSISPTPSDLRDRFHLMKLVNEAVDAVRKGEVLTQPDLKKSRWLWLKNEGNLKVKQKEKLQELLKDQNLKTAQAYQFRLTFQDIFTVKNRYQGATLLKAWMENAKDSGLPPIVKVAYTIMNHWDGVLRWFESQITNGILEGFNSLIQSAKAKARGYRTHKNFINMAYLILGKLDLRLPT